MSRPKSWAVLKRNPKPEPLRGQGRRFTSESHRREDVERLNHNSPEEIEARIQKAINKGKNE